DIHSGIPIRSAFVDRGCIMVGDAFTAFVKILGLNGTGNTPGSSSERRLRRLNRDVKYTTTQTDSEYYTQPFGTRASDLHACHRISSPLVAALSVSSLHKRPANAACSSMAV